MIAEVAGRNDASIELTRPFTAHRLSVVMEPRDNDPLEEWGVLNPASARGPDGELYLFPRLVAKGNYSRVGIARVRFDSAGDPASVERLGIALEPVEDYEKNPVTGGGCEDPRITYVDPLGCYVMTYTAFSPVGPRIAIAISRDLFSWERLGLVRFAPGDREDLNNVDNKDAVLFPTPITNPKTGQACIGLVHRPTFLGSSIEPDGRWWEEPAEVDTGFPGPSIAKRPRLRHPAVWLSYSSELNSVSGLTNFTSHRRLLSSRESWERTKVGGGPPPLLTPHGWLMIYHGVRQRAGHYRYSAGAVVLDQERPERVIYRTAAPILAPGHDDQLGIVPDVVFPTAVDRRTDIGMPERLDVYYGMADSRIGVATMTLPLVLDISKPTRPKRTPSLEHLSRAQ